MNHEKLLPCPFCGGDAHLFDGSWVECTKCGCQTPETFEEVVISAWNRRTPPAAVPDGWVMVPRRPDENMKSAVRDIAGPEALAYALAGWNTFISAAPAAPTEASDE